MKFVCLSFERKLYVRSYIYIFKIFIARLFLNNILSIIYPIFTFLKPESQRNTKKKIFFSRFTFEKSFLARILQSWNIL